MPKVHIMDHEMNFCLSPTSVLNYYAETFAFHSSVTKGSRLSTVTTMKGFSVFFFLNVTLYNQIYIYKTKSSRYLS